MNKLLKDTYFVYVILFSGFATSFFASKNGLISLFIVGFLIFFTSHIQPSKKLFIALGIWLLYFIANTIVVAEFNPFFMATYIIKIMIAWWLISYYGERIFMKYETIIYSLCIISLFFWVWELVDFSSLNKIMTSYNLSGTEGRIFEKGTKSILVYTSFYNRAIYAIPRNSGFTWEPGPFSSYIVIALYINLARQNFQIINNKRFFVFLITLITTQSTTGLIGFLAIIIWTALNKYRNKYVILGLPISLCIVAYLFFTVPFLQQKIIEESQEDIEMAIRRSIKYNLDITPGRFAGMKLGLMDFKNHPITGYGGQPALRYAEQRGASVATVNGFAGILARYGIFGILIFLFFIFKTGIWLSNHFNFDYFWFFPLIVLIISFSFSIIESPLLFSLWFFAFFYHETFINEESVYGES